MKTLSTILFILFYTFTLAGDLHSIVSGGNFTSTSSWSIISGGASCNCTPGSNDDIYIEEDIILDEDLSCYERLEISTSRSLTTTTYDLEIKRGGLLVVYGTLEVNDLTFFNGSIVMVLPSGSIIVHGDLTNMNNSDSVVINGGIYVSHAFDNGNGGSVTGTGTITAETFTGTGTTFGNENSSIPDGAEASSSLSLPIELISFTAEKNEDDILLKWSTATEINNECFVIERSYDGIEFDVISIIPGAGNSNAIINYKYTDDNYIKTSNIIYYRLKQNDFDGNFEYFNMVAVSMGDDRDIECTVYPNPFKNNIYVDFSNTIDSSILIKMNDAIGNMVYNNEFTTESNRIDINTRSLSDGIYIIVIENNNIKFTRKIIKK